MFTRLDWHEPDNKSSLGSSQLLFIGEAEFIGRYVIIIILLWRNEKLAGEFGYAGGILKVDLSTGKWRFL